MPIRKATPEDAPAIRDLTARFGMEAKPGLLEQQLAELQNDPRHQVLVYEAHEKVLGYAVIHFLPRPALTRETVLISDLIAEPSDHNLYITRALEDQISQLARERKCYSIALHCQTLAAERRKLYEKQGYTAHDRYYAKRFTYTD